MTSDNPTEFEQTTEDQLTPQVSADLKDDFPGGTVADGCGMTVIAMVFSAPAIWMHWMLRKFADRDEWFDFIVRLVLDEMITALGLFAVLIVIWGFFAPRWLEPIMQWSVNNMAKAVFLIFVLLFGGLILFIFAFAILSAFGVRF